ncbi:MAG TPA: AraC family transcriptional regulator [Blastocatellia bacterium]|nr:AraC family transcriptional regulator [Blastocatellia bacterium]
MTARRDSSAFYGSESASWQLAAFTLSESVYPAQLNMPVHRHEPAYFGIVLKGSYTETVASRTRDCKHLTTVFHPPGETHSVVFHNSDVRVFRIELGESSRKRIQEHARVPDEPIEFRGGLLASLALRLYGEYRNRDAWSPLASEGLLLEIMAELSRHRERDSDRSVPRWLADVRDAVTSRLTHTPSLSELAEAVGVHRVHLAREFRKSFHCTIGEFVRRLRIETACEEIARSDQPIADIALELGFCDQSHFSNTFKRFTGMTPAAYRATCRSS